MTDVRQWLNSLGLDQYAEAFDENAVGWEQLPRLDHDILKDIGVKAAGHRMKLLEAAAGLSGVETSPSSDPPKHAPPPAISGSTGEVERRQFVVVVSSVDQVLFANESNELTGTGLRLSDFDVDGI